MCVCWQEIHTLRKSKHQLNCERFYPSDDPDVGEASSQRHVLASPSQLANPHYFCRPIEIDPGHWADVFAVGHSLGAIVGRSGSLRAQSFPTNRVGFVGRMLQTPTTDDLVAKAVKPNPIQR
jgi:hypothetical protein